MIIDEYIAYQNKYEKKFGEKTIVLMEVGSFFEYYGIETDTDTWGPIRRVAKVLDAYVTKKNKKKASTDKGNPLMAGFPNHSVDKHVEKLLKASYTVILITQDKHGSANPDREVSAIYSPGTNLQYNKTFNSNYLACIYLENFKFLSTGKKGISVGFSIVDVSTGENKLFETASKQEDIYYAIDELYRLLQVYEPKEILIYLNNDFTIEQDTLINQLELSKTTYYFRKQASEHGNKLYQEEMLNKVFKVNTNLSVFEYLHLERQDISLKSYVCLLKFAYEHNENILQKINKPITIDTNDRLILTYNSVKQLNILPNIYSEEQAQYDSLLSIVNKCKTSMGKRLLKYMLTNPITSVDTLNNRYASIDFLRQNVDNTHRYKLIEQQLANIIDLQRSHRKMRLGYLQPAEFIGVDLAYFKVNNILKLILDFQKENFSVNLNSKTISKFEEYCALYKSTLKLDVLSKFYKDTITQNIFKEGVYPQIDVIQSKIDKYNLIFKTVAEKLSTFIKDKKQTKIDNTLIKVEKTERDGKYLTCTKRRAALLKKAISKLDLIEVKHNGEVLITINPKEIEYKNRSSMTRIEIYQLSDKADKLMGAEEKMNRHCRIHFKALFQELHEKYGDTLDLIVNTISEMDVYMAAAKTSLLYNYCRPTLKQGESFIHAKQLRHPIIERINDKVDYIPNDVTIGGDNKTGMLLYGCNACGKSSYMKAVGVNLIFAQSGFFVAAEQFNYSPYETLFTRISGDDNMFKGQSSFAVEMMELRNIFKRCNSKSLVLGDELCKGTESTSGLAIVAAGICQLIKKQTQFVFATHIHGLDTVQEIKSLYPAVKAYHLSVNYNSTTGVLVYDRLLKEGSGSSLYGLEVCRAMDMEPDFLKQANSIRKRLANINESLLGEEKKSNYNKKVFMDMCRLCLVNKAEETHHIKYQKDADENNFIGHVPKNNQSNLVPLCKKCHSDETYGRIKILGWIDTSEGRKLNVEKNLELKKKRKKRKLIFNQEDVKIIETYIHNYPNLKMTNLLLKINQENNLGCTKYTLRKIKNNLINNKTQVTENYS